MPQLEVSTEKVTKIVVFTGNDCQVFDKHEDWEDFEDLKITIVDNIPYIKIVGKRSEQCFYGCWFKLVFE